MRILHTADWHLGKLLDGRSRLDEQASFLDDLVRIADERDVQLILIAGDVYDSVNPPARAEALFYDALKRLSKGGSRLIVVVAGNHDSPNRLTAALPLAMEHGVLIAGLPGSVAAPGMYGRHRVTRSGAGFAEVEMDGEIAVILTVAYPSERRLNEVLYGELAADQACAVSYNERVRALFAELSANFRQDAVNLAVSHLFATGASTGGSERCLQLGGSYLVDADCLPANADYIALGHIHKPQIVGGTGGRARYAGSPIAYHRDEAGQEKGVFFVDAVAGRPAAIEFVPLPVYKPIRALRFGGAEAAIAWCEAHAKEACYAYLAIETDEFVREADMRRMRAAMPDLVEICPIPTGQRDDACAEAARPRDFEALFRDYFERRTGAKADEALVRLLMEIAAQEDEDEAD